MADGRWGIFSEDGGGSKDGIKKGPIHAFFNDHPQAKKRGVSLSYSLIMALR